MINKIDQKKIKVLIESEHWDVIATVFEEIKKKWNDIPVKGDTEWETLWNVAQKEAKIEGVRDFINNLEEIAHGTD